MTKCFISILNPYYSNIWKFILAIQSKKIGVDKVIIEQYNIYVVGRCPPGKEIIKIKPNVQ